VNEANPHTLGYVKQV